MGLRLRFALAAAALGVFIIGPILLSVWVVGAQLTPETRQAVAAAVSPHLPVVVLLVGVLVAIAIAALNKLFQQYVKGLLRIAEQQQLMMGANRDFRLAEEGPEEMRAIARGINALAQQRDELLRDVSQQIDAAKRNVEQEKERLAALMSELTQSVVVCNLDGRILLYNNQARQQFRMLSDAPMVADGGELIGLGRSIYAAFDRNLVAHALETLQHRQSRDAAVAHFVTTSRSGQLLRVQMSPVWSRHGEQASAQVEGDGRVMTGFILMLDNITRHVENEARRDQMLHTLTEGSRAALANVRAAAEMLDFPDLDEAMHARFLTVIRDEVKAMSERLDHTANQFADALKARWPLEEMLGSDLIAAVQRRIESRFRIPSKLEEINEGIWLKVDSFSLVQALSYLVHRLVDEFGVREVRFRLSQAGRLAHLDLIWQGQAMSTETVMSWEMEPMTVGSETSPLTVRDVIDRHDGELWLEREKVRHRAFFRFLLPCAVPQHASQAGLAPAKMESRPEYYDFDLFQWTDRSSELDDRLLSELTYTVFDTETTGLNPSQGDEIIQIGATRIVNGKMLRHESFEQLVDPRRPLSPESIPIHGIQPEMLVGQPTIDTVLPAFHAFAHDTVLIAHNAAFDMRFLQLKEERTGLKFDQPVLDTLFLSAVLHPNQESHRLEAIAERLNLTIVGRHTALGDAMVTAEVFLKMIPLLADKGIHTLRQAREAAEKTYYARIKY